MPHDVFPLSRILITAAVCGLVAFLLLAWRGRGNKDARRTGLMLALLIGAPPMSAAECWSSWAGSPYRDFATAGATGW